MTRRVFITGPPGVGKTTLIRQAAERLSHRKPAGFFTRELREHGARKGFELVSFDGRRALLAHVAIPSPHRVGRYRVDLEAFERFLDSLELDRSPGSLLVVDEIGKMECLSSRFRSLVRSVLSNDRDILATIAQKGTPFIESIKQQPGIRLFTLSEANRQRILDEVCMLLE